MTRALSPKSCRPCAGSGSIQVASDFTRILRCPRCSGRGRLLVVLNRREDACWVHAFAAAVNRNRTEVAAEAAAWRSVVAAFPRLRVFDGCEARGRS